MLRRTKWALGILIMTAGFLSSWGQTSSTPAAPLPGTVSGTVTYSERMALPADAAIDVKLQDITLHGKTIGESVFAPGTQQVPIPFQLNYNPADINPTHIYQLQANISVNGKMMFVSTTPYPVITQGAPSQANMMLQPAPAQTATAGGRKLTDTHWNLVELNGQGVVPGSDGKPAHLELYKTGQLSGSTGCNNIAGSYLAADGGLQFTPGATTMMACPPRRTQQEQAFFAALKATSSYRIEGDSLQLLNGQQVLARFQARAKK
jgi:putative lipoprotein